MSMNFDNEETIWKRKVQSLLESGGVENINEAKKICDLQNIPWSQYESWEGNDNTDSLEDIISQDNISITTTNATKDTNNLYNNTNRNNSNNNSSNSEKREKTTFHKSFPYTKKELQKLKVPDLRLIIAGCKSTYASREILEVLNKSEYLGKMSSTLALKFDHQFQEDLLSKLKSNTNKISVDDGFNQTIKYLDNISYAKNNWAQKVKYSEIQNSFDSKPHAQEERLKQIPEIEKKYFLRSVFANPIITPDAMSNPSSEFFDYRMNSYNKKEHVNLLYEILQNKWDNKDVAPDSVSSINRRK